MTKLRNVCFAVALALPAAAAQADPTWGTGANQGFFNNFEIQLRTVDACQAGGCLPSDPNNPTPQGYQIVDPTIAGNVQVGDIFTGILNVQNIDANGGTVYFQAPGNHFSGYFAQEVAAITPAAGDPSGEGHITLTAAATDPFGVLSAGEMFRLYSNVGVFQTNGTFIDDINNIITGTFWAALGLTAEGFAYTHSDLTATINASDTASFLGIDVILEGPGYNAGLLALINDINENEVGGLSAGLVCSPAEIANPAIRCTQIIATSELELNPDWQSGVSPWVFRSNDPFTLFTVPEPGSLALVALSLIGLGAFSRRRLA